MKELVLYYTPSPAPHVAKLKSVLVRMGVRIKNIGPEQVNQTVGYLAGLPGFEAQADAVAEDAVTEDAVAEDAVTEDAVTEDAVTEDAVTEGAKTEGAEVRAAAVGGASAERAGVEAGTAGALPVIPEEVLVMKNFTSSRIDALLYGLRKAGVPKIALKAIITESNSKWTFYQLYEELKEEHVAMSAPRTDETKLD